MRTLHTLVVTTEPIRLQLRPLLAGHADVRVMAEVGSLAEAREALALLSADLVVFECGLGREDGFDLLPAVPLSARVICLTGDTADTLRALSYGSLECVPLPVIDRVFLARLNSVRQGHAIDSYAPMEYAEMGYRSLHCDASIAK